MVTNCPAPPSHKVTVVGAGAVGMACAFSILTQNVSNHISLIDSDPKRLEGEVLDLQHGSAFIRNANISGSTGKCNRYTSFLFELTNNNICTGIYIDYQVSVGSRVCIIAAGVRRKVGENRLNLIQRNADILKDVIPKLVIHSPDAIILVASNPVDLLTYTAWQLSGLPSNRVIGAGTNLDSSRFRFLISQRLGVAPESCHGWIIGEHGDSSGIYLYLINVLNL